MIDEFREYQEMNVDLFVKGVCKKMTKEQIVYKWVSCMEHFWIYRKFIATRKPYTIHPHMLWLDPESSDFLYEELTKLNFIDCHPDWWTFVIEAEVLKELFRFQEKEFPRYTKTRMPKYSIPRINWLGKSKQLYYLVNSLSEYGHLKNKEAFLSKCFKINGKIPKRKSVSSQLKQEPGEMANDLIRNITDKLPQKK